tara:strand:+ start:346 stop:948 length:603 start_codon:yes stop_codon:yes gene_type:complete
MSLESFYAPKDTKIFVLYEATTAERMTDSARLVQTVQSFEQYGYKCTLQPFPSTDQIINNSYESIGVKKLPLYERALNTFKMKEWYGFFSIAKKARILDRQYIISFAGNQLVDDMRSLPRPMLDGYYADLKTSYRFPSDPTNLTTRKNYLMDPIGAIEMLKEVKVSDPIRVSIHDYMIAYHNCDTLEVNMDLRSVEGYEK